MPHKTDALRCTAFNIEHVDQCSDPQILGLNNGHVGLGQTDVRIFDPTTPWRVEAKALKSQGKNTPFLGYEMIGKVRYTLMAGHGVYEG